jgi:uncharacterized membrane-anchored protein YjiN (DUF445 family)
MARRRSAPCNRAASLRNSAETVAAGLRAQQAARLKALATGLLLLMAVLFFASTWAMGAIDPRFVWVQAFAEAAMIGGLADWFAVTALFRHPMGLPIPHTAIIPRSKDRIGEALATFLRDNFLTPRNVARRLSGFDAAKMVAGRLDRPAGEGRMRRSIGRLIVQLSETEAAASIMNRLRDGAMARLRETDIAPLLGRMLDAMIADGRHHPVIDALIAWAERTLVAQEGLIRTMVHDRTAWLLRLMKLDDRIADELVRGLRGLLHDLANDPDHPVRERADLALANLAFDLQHMPETREKVERLKQELLDNPALGDWMEGLWSKMGEGIRRLAEGDGLDRIGPDMAGALRHDPTLADAVNSLARRAVIGTVKDHGDAIVALVSDTVKTWDAQTVTDKLESAVSRDLQYIRLNGTLIGGSIGVALHALLLLFAAA